MSVKDIKKNEKFLIYRMNDQTQNNQPTFVFKTLSVSLEIAENREVKTSILLMHLLILMETRNEPKE